ncbi:MAG: IPT/TIG domain-containing protein [Acidimicrobiales bacterium]
MDITISTAGETSATTSADRFSYEPVPTITSVSPSSGPVAGRTVVSVTGAGFVAGATTAKFGTSGATAISCTSTTSCSVTSPSQSAGTVDVTLSTPGGTSTVVGADRFTYNTAPAVTGVTPSAGPTAGGTVVTVTGTGFSGATAVSFGASSAVFSVVSATSIQATSPPAAAGTFDVTVSTPGGTSATSMADRFSADNVPTVAHITPNGGRLGGGAVVTVTGTGFVAGATKIAFGSSAGTAVSCPSKTSCTAKSPVRTAGAVNVTVSTPGGTSASTTATRFGYDRVPTISRITPSTGRTAGGTVVTITGVGFVAGSTTVMFGSKAGTHVSCTSTTSCKATSSAGKAGAVALTVTTPGGTSSKVAADKFTYSNSVSHLATKSSSDAQASRKESSSIGTPSSAVPSVMKAKEA